MKNYSGDIFRFVQAGILLIIITGCTSVPKDLGRSDVDALLSERGVPISQIEAENTRSYIESLISAPLVAESAVRIVLVKNPQLKKNLCTFRFGCSGCL